MWRRGGGEDFLEAKPVFSCDYVCGLFSKDSYWVAMGRDLSICVSFTIISAIVIKLYQGFGWVKFIVTCFVLLRVFVRIGGKTMSFNRYLTKMKSFEISD